MAGDKRKIGTLERLSGALGARRMADARELSDAMAAIDRLDRARADIEGAIASVMREIDPQDLESWRRLDAWRALQTQKLAALAAERVEAVTTADILRAKLRRSHGEVEAVKLLIASARRGRRLGAEPQPG